MAELSTSFREFVRKLLIKGCNMKEMTLRILREKYQVHTERDSFSKQEKLQMKTVIVEELQKFLGSEPAEPDVGSAPTSLPETPSKRSTRGSQQILGSPNQDSLVTSTTANASSTRPTSKPKRMSAEQAVDMLIGKGKDDVDSLPVGPIRRTAPRSSSRKRSPVRVSPTVQRSSPRRMCRAKKTLSSEQIMAEIVNDKSDSDSTSCVDQQEENYGDVDKGGSGELVEGEEYDEDTDVEGCSNGVDETVDEKESDVPKSDVNDSDDGSFVEWRPVKKKKKVAVESDDSDFEMDGCDTILLSPLRKGKGKSNESKTSSPMSKGKSPLTNRKPPSPKGVSVKKGKQKTDEINERFQKSLDKKSLKIGAHDKKVMMGYFVDTERKECKVILQKLNMDSQLSAVSFYRNKPVESSLRAKSDRSNRSRERYEMGGESHSSDTDVGDVTPRQEQLTAVRYSTGNSKRKPPEKGVNVGAGSSEGHSSSDDELLSVDTLRSGKSPQKLLRERRDSRRKSSRMSSVLNESYAETLSSDSDTDVEQMYDVKYKKKTKKAGENKPSSAALKSKQSAPKGSGDTCTNKLGQRSPRKCAVFKKGYAETQSSDEDEKSLTKSMSNRPRRESPRKVVTVRQETVMGDSSSDTDVVDITPKKRAMKKMHSKDQKKEVNASDSDTDVWDVTPKKGSDKGKVTDSISSPHMSEGNQDKFSESGSDTDIGEVVRKRETFAKDNESPSKHASSAKRGRLDLQSSSDDESLSTLRSGMPQRNPPRSPERCSPRKTAVKSYFDSPSSDSDELPELDSAKKSVGASEDCFTLSSDEEALKALIDRKSPRKMSPRKRTPDQPKSQKSQRKAACSRDSDEEPLTVIKSPSRMKKTSLKKVSKQNTQESSDLDTSSLDISDSEIIPRKSSDHSKKAASFQKAKKKESIGQGRKRKRSQNSSQESESAGGQRKKAAKLNKDGSLEKQYKFLVRVNREAGLFVHYRAMKNMNEEKKITFLKEALEKAGMKGRPTLEKAEELKLQREVAELNAGDIINIDSGNSKRSSRSRSQATSNRPAPKPQTPAKIRFSRLSDIIDSEGSSD